MELRIKPALRQPGWTGIQERRNNPAEFASGQKKRSSDQLFSKQWCRVITVSAVREKSYDHFTLVLRAFSKLDCCIESCTG